MAKWWMRITRSLGWMSSAASGRRHAFELELLQARGGLRDVDVALGIGRAVRAPPELAWHLDPAHYFERLAVNDQNALAGADVEELLRCVGRERKVARERRRGPDELLH